MRALALQCALINPPFKIPMDPPLPLSDSLISRSLYIFFSLLPQIVKSRVLSWRKTLQIFPAKLLLLSSSDMFHQDPVIRPCSLGFFISGKLVRMSKEDPASFLGSRCL
ncbi:hypothetical protein Bca4012_042698 [Brassica carinata]